MHVLSPCLVLGIDQDVFALSSAVMIRFECYLILQEHLHALWLAFFCLLPQVMLLWCLLTCCFSLRSARQLSLPALTLCGLCDLAYVIQLACRHPVLIELSVILHILPTLPSSLSLSANRLTALSFF